MRGDARVARYLGREALVLGNGGEAYYPAARFVDGTIEFDVAVSVRRTFVGVHFHAASEDVWEDVYIRPHKSGLVDAVQYAPAFADGRSAWQLYHGPGETAAARFQPDVWVHALPSRAADDMNRPVNAKLVVKGTRAAYFQDWSCPASHLDRAAGSSDSGRPSLVRNRVPPWRGPSATSSSGPNPPISRSRQSPPLPCRRGSS